MLKRKIAFSLSEEVVSRLKSQAPGGNTSKYLNDILIDYLKIDINPGNHNNPKLQDIINHYRREKMKIKADDYKEGFASGHKIVMNKDISYILLNDLVNAKEFYDSRPGMNFTRKWYEFDNDELTDIFNNYRNEHEDDDSFFDGFFDGILDMWKEIETAL